MSFKSDMFSLGIIITELVTGDKGIPDNDKNNVRVLLSHYGDGAIIEIP